MNSCWKYLVPFVFALVVFPASVFLHECGHYLVGGALGFGVKLHYAETTTTRSKASNQKDALVSAAGPAATAILAMAGYFWLRALRKPRLLSPPSLADWLATSFALNVGRWFRDFNHPFSNPQPRDEANVSSALGLPPWLLPCLLALLAIVAFVAIVRLHPPRSRLIPFTCAVLGGCLGLFLWFRFLGPWLLP